MCSSENLFGSKYERIQFVRAANSILVTAQNDSKSFSKASISGKEVRDFYEALLGEPSNSKIANETNNVSGMNSQDKSGIVQQHNYKRKRLKKVCEDEKDCFRKIMQLFKDATDGNLQGVRDYYNKGLDINVLDQYDWTPLMCASYAGHLHIVKYLLSKGADITKRSKSGETAAELALKCGHHKLREYISCSAQMRKQKPSRYSKSLEEKLEDERFCDACQCNYVGEAHLSSVTHLLETRKPVLDPGYGIPEWNKGYRILRSSGWDEFQGLGRNASGGRYPIKTVLKIDRRGLGFPTDNTAKVTHFMASDADAIKKRSGTSGKEFKDYKKRLLHEKNFERQMRTMFSCI